MAIKIVSTENKLVLRPREGAPVVSFPRGAKISPYGVNNDTPSVVVCNGTESPPSWQGVDYSTGVVIVNGVPLVFCEIALRIFSEGVIVAEILGRLARLGLNDQGTALLSYVDKHLQAVESQKVDDYTGVFTSLGTDKIPCWKEGQDYFVEHDGKPRVIEPTILLQTYRLPDGSRLSLSDIPEGRD